MLDLRFWREGERSHWDVVTQVGGVQVKEQAWHPWPVGGQPYLTNGA